MLLCSYNESELHDISTAHGLVHLRNALLEDHSFNWPPAKIAPDVEWTQWTQGLQFRDGSTGVLVLFSSDFKFVRMVERRGDVVCANRYAKGLREMFAEFPPPLRRTTGLNRKRLVTRPYRTSRQPTR